MSLNPDLLELLRAPSTCYLATTMPDGSPQLTQTWVDTDGEHVVAATTDGGVEHVEALSRQCTGGPYPWHGGRDQVRVVLSIAVDEVHVVG
ncbi:pyridoxamine 5'-phosphate oxidase family protein [Kineococcus arenarius]|uniref:pyridoxamine 5'-phosphate oxidase family protein n=1 Tax=unclassified Kineococcus TaxID=2621656 RepID=UPI003D7C60AE